MPAEGIILPPESYSNIVPSPLPVLARDVKGSKQVLSAPEDIFLANTKPTTFIIPSVV